MSSHLSDSRREKTLDQMHEISKTQLWHVETIEKRMSELKDGLDIQTRQLGSVIDILTNILSQMEENTDEENK